MKSKRRESLYWSFQLTDIMTIDEGIVTSECSQAGFSVSVRLKVAATLDPAKFIVRGYSS